MVLKDLKDRIAELTNSGETASETAKYEEYTTERPVEIGTVFEMMKNHRRRYVLRYLVMNNGRVVLDNLTEHVAAWEQDKPIEAISPQERKRVYISLYQNHLPKMDTVSAISYDKPSGAIKRGEHFGFFRQYLPPEEDPQRQQLIDRG